MHCESVNAPVCGFDCAGCDAWGILAFLSHQKMFFDSPKSRFRTVLVGHLARRCLIAALVAGLRSAAADDGPAPRPRVVATTTIVADLVREVAGERVEVECLMAAGVDPHAYRATPRDAGRLLAARLVVASGLRLEGRLATLLGRLGTRVPVVHVADHLPPERLMEAGVGMPDPHVWFDAGLWSLAPAVVADALADVDPVGAELYRARADEMAGRLRSLDDQVRAAIASLPADRRVLVTAHDAFRYFGRAYGMEVVGVQGTNTSAEAGLGDINRLVELIVSRRIPAVFLETSVGDRDVMALVEGAAARGWRVRLGGTLSSDSLGGPGSGAETVADALRLNAAVILAALREPPPDGAGTGKAP